MKWFRRWLDQADVQTTARAIRESRGFLSLAYLIIVMDMVGTGLMLLSPVPMKIAVDSVLGDAPLPGPLDDWLPADLKEPEPLLWVVTIMLLIIVFLMQFQSLVTTMMRTRASEQITRRFRRKLFTHLQLLPMADLDRMGTADPIYRLQYDAPAIQWIVIGSLVPYISALASFLFMLIVIVQINVKLAIAAVAVMPIMILLSRRHRQKMPPMYEDLKANESCSLGTFYRALPLIRLVKAYGRARQESARFSSLSARAVGSRMQVTLAENRFGLIVNVITAVASAAVLFIGFSSIRAGELTVGALLVVIAYLGAIYAPLNSVVHLFANMQEQLSGARRCFALLDKPVEPECEQTPKHLPKTRGRIRFDDVWFHYNEKPVLRGFSLEVAPGTSVGITGPTGVGKSTLLHLLLRFYRPDKGRIELDGTALSSVPLRELRSRFAMAPQEAVLFNGTVAENIGYGRPGVERAAIIEAAKAAQAHSFISRLPDGYDSFVGENGTLLSGGERQRIVLARALVRDAPLLLLDEPTSAMDLDTERLVVDALRDITRDRTSLIITHRPSILTLCDRVVCIDEGRCREIGAEPGWLRAE